MVKRKIYAGAVVIASGLLLCAPVQAGHVIESATDEMKVTIYGQVNRALLWVDDGTDSSTRFVDNDHASTRIGLRGRLTIDSLTAGMRIEGAINPNASNHASISQSGRDGGNTSFATRHADVYLQSKPLGTLSLGQGSRATDGIDENDLSITKVIGYSDPRKYAGGFYFTDGTAPLTIRISDIGRNLNGSRASRVRYDSPVFAGLTLSTSTQGGHDEDLALRYSRKYQRLQVVAGAGYRTTKGEDDLSGSASVLFSNGLSVSLSAGRRDFAAGSRKDANYYYGKLGYQRNLIAAGPTGVAVDFGSYRNFSTAQLKMDGLGLMAVQALTRWGTELYAGYRNYGVDLAQAKDLHVLMSGMRIVF